MYIRTEKAQIGFEAHPAFEWVKWPGRVADYSHQSSAKGNERVELSLHKLHNGLL
jgi:hypothetical protein